MNKHTHAPHHLFSQPVKLSFSLAMIAVVVALVFILLSLLLLLCKYFWDAEDKRNGITGPPVIPILGNIIDVSKAAAEFKSTYNSINFIFL